MPSTRSSERSRRRRLIDNYIEKIYNLTCRHLIKPVMNGYNATVFAYGPTGTGKTHTMLGNQEVMGLSVLTI